MTALNLVPKLLLGNDIGAQALLGLNAAWAMVRNAHLHNFEP